MLTVAAAQGPAALAVVRLLGGGLPNAAVASTLAPRAGAVGLGTDPAGGLRRQLRILDASIAGARAGHSSLLATHRDQPIVAAIADYMGGGGFFGSLHPPSEAIWVDALSLLAAAQRKLDGGDLAGCAHTVAAASQAYDRAYGTYVAYRTGTIAGAQHSTTALEVTAAAGAIAATLASGGAAAAGGASLLAVSAEVGLTAGVYGGLQTEATQGGEMLAGSRRTGAFDVGAIVRRAGRDAVTGLVGSLVGGAASRYAASYFGRLALNRMSATELAAASRALGVESSAVSPEVALGAVRRFWVELGTGTATTPLTTGVEVALASLSGESAPRDPRSFVRRVIDNAVQGGLLQVFLGALSHGAAHAVRLRGGAGNRVAGSSSGHLPEPHEATAVPAVTERGSARLSAATATGPAAVRVSTAEGTAPARTATGVGQVRGGIVAPRDTRGASGQPTRTPHAGAEHLGVLADGQAFLEQVHPELPPLLTALHQTPPQQPRIDAIAREIGQIYVDHDPTFRGPPSPLRDELVARIDQLHAESVRLQEQGELLHRAARAAAQAGMKALREGLLRRGSGPAAGAAARLDYDESVAAALPAQRTVEDVRRNVQEFLQLAQGRGPDPGIRVHATAPRASTNPRSLDLGTKETGLRRIVYHELAHHLEFQDPALAEAALRFVQARAARAADGGPVRRVSLREHTGNAAYRVDEHALLGDFFDPYVGREYPVGTGPLATEVVSTGAERFTSDAEMVLFYLQDAEHFVFTIGALTRSPRPREGSR